MDSPDSKGKAGPKGKTLPLMEARVGFSGRCSTVCTSIEARSLSPRTVISPLRNKVAITSTNSQLVTLQFQVPTKCLRRSRAGKVFATLQTADRKAELLAELKPGQIQEFHQLPSGLKLEVIVQNADNDSRRKQTPLVFIHGSMHAAWCWAFRWMPFFSARGYDCHAISFLGHGASDVPQGPVAGTLESHAEDIAHFIKSNFSIPPVLIAHSFGGLVTQRYLSSVGTVENWNAEGKLLPRPAGVVLACSTPPTGNGPMVMRFLKRDFGASLKITLGFAAKMIGTSISMCRDCLFSQDFPETELKEYMALMKKSSRIPILDVRNISKSLPVPRPPEDAPPCLVLHAENDYVVDSEGSEETAEWCRTKLVVVPEIAHDLMLDTQWEDAAMVVNSWLEEHFL
ncbi:hypothetical protein R1sor_017134 [Riccia sorocarpa]|uniref:AB hydrolase-1 domain-containing protein n=1 Tax=Riccia sorocarpa TaxID=122646 RepID=A0ABD3I8Q9_9MARC